MRSGPKLAVRGALAAASLLASGARAQPDLPPPPPPPMGQPTDLPPLPPPPRPSSTAPAPAQPPPRRATQPPAPPPPVYYPPPPVRRRREREVVYVVEEPTSRPFAVTFNPLGIFWGRLSANLELLLVPHHSLVLSPNVLLFNEPRSGAISDGLGFATGTSSGFGAELGYHYWFHWHRALRGPYLGPSLLLGSTTNVRPELQVANPANAQTYWGVAFDVGGQEVLPGGFTLGGGLGLGVVRMANQADLFPRILFQMGWSF